MGIKRFGFANFLHFIVSKYQKVSKIQTIPKTDRVIELKKGIGNH